MARMGYQDALATAARTKSLKRSRSTVFWILHVAVAVDGRDVAGIEESLCVQNIALLLVVGARNRRAAHLEPPEGFPVPRQPLAGIVGDLHLHHERRVPLRLLDVEPRFALEPG